MSDCECGASREPGQWINRGYAIVVSMVARSNCHCYNTSLFAMCRAMTTVPHSVPDCVPSTSATVLTLEEDVEGATLKEPLDGKTVPQLQ